MGVRTRLVTAAGGEHAAALWAACAADRAGAAESGLLLGEGSDDESAELTVVIAVLDRRAPDLANTPTTEKTLLAVATAAATEQELARVAVAVDDAGRQVDGIVVADPDRADRTSGRHTMDERSRQVPLPVRLTGVTPVEQASADPRRGRR